MKRSEGVDENVDAPRSRTKVSANLKPETPAPTVPRYNNDFFFLFFSLKTMFSLYCCLHLLCKFAVIMITRGRCLNNMTIQNAL